MNYLSFNQARWNRVAASRSVPYAIPLSHEEFESVKNSPLSVHLVPEKPVPLEWFQRAPGKRLLGLACGGGQQGPIFASHGYEVTIMDYSTEQLASDRMVAEREGLAIETVLADMTQPFPFADASFDLIFCPVSNIFIADLQNLWQECSRILCKGGLLMVGYMNPWVFMYDTDIVWDHPEIEPTLTFPLPFDPVELEKQGKFKVDPQYGYEFSHTLESQIGGKLRAGFAMLDFMEARDGRNPLSRYQSDYLCDLCVKV